MNINLIFDFQLPSVQTRRAWRACPIAMTVLSASVPNADGARILRNKPRILLIKSALMCRNLLKEICLQYRGLRCSSIDKSAIVCT